MEKQNPNIHTETVIQPPLPEVGSGLPTKKEEILVATKAPRTEMPKYTKEEIAEFDKDVEYWKK